MSKKIIIPITISSPVDPNECTAQYVLEYKRDGDVNYTALPPTLDNPIFITNADADTLYNIRLTRYCCNQATKTSETTYTTSP